MNADTLALLESKDFEQLNSAEKASVLKEMSEKEYREERKLILTAIATAKKEKAELKPNSQILKAAKEKLPERKSKGLPIFQHKIPTWAAVAACILIFLGVRSMNYFNDRNIENHIITETIRDTIYQEKVVTESLPADTIIEYIYVNQTEEIHEEKDHPVNLVQKEPSFEHLHFKEDEYCNIMSCYSSQKGITAANDTLLWMAHVKL